MILFPTVVVAMGANIVKAFEWRQHVLYSPHNSRRNWRTADIVKAEAPQK
jgi:hypothetical protein